MSQEKKTSLAAGRFLAFQPNPLSRTARGAAGRRGMARVVAFDRRPVSFRRDSDPPIVCDIRLSAAPY
jgi:hypothetical protein